MNFDRLRFVAERAEVGEAREALFAVTIPEKRGALLAFCKLLGDRSVTEFNYRIADDQAAQIFLGVAIQDTTDIEAMVRIFTQAGFPTLDLTHNELGKLHIRHLVGGRSVLAQDELLYRFEFPERPGALARFLSAMSPNWNISLFHYRNHGADYGRVLLGLQVPKNEKRVFRQFLTALAYQYWDESQNPAYRLFLSME
jgi:threonine dehydratase